MENKTISDLRELSTVSNSNVLVVETNAETFKVTKENLLKEVNEELNTKSNINHTHDGYVTESELNAKGYATETFVTNKIAEASLSGGAVDLSGYATEEYVDTKVAENTDKITVLNANMNSRYSNQQIDEKVSEMIITKINGDLVFRDVFEGEKFEINEDNVVVPPTDIYGNILISTTTLSFAENASTTFTVKLDKAPTNDQVVNLSVNNAYCTLSKTNLTFTSSNYSTAQTVTVAGVHDPNNYSNKTSIINLTSPNVANKTISVTIKNVDTPSEDEVIPVLDLDIANWDETTTITDKRGNYHFTIDDISKYRKTEDGGIFITSSSPASTTFETPTSYSVRIKMTYDQLVANYGRFWRWDGDTPSFFAEKQTNILTFKVSGKGGTAWRCSTPNTYTNVPVDVVCCYEATTKAIAMYINGEEVGESLGTMVASSISTPLALGNVEANGYNIDFVLYAFQVYDRALNAEQVRGLYYES